MKFKAKQDIKVVDRFILKGEEVLLLDTCKNGDTLITDSTETLMIRLTNAEFSDMIELDV